MTEQRFDRHRAFQHPLHVLTSPPDKDRLPPPPPPQTDPQTAQTPIPPLSYAPTLPQDFFKNCKNFVTISSVSIDLTNIQNSYQKSKNPVEHCLTDIADTQSKMLRANGHCNLKISIAQHQIIASYFVLDSLSKGASLPFHLHPAVALQALFHDASENLTGDIPTPIKEFFNLSFTLAAASFGAKQAEKALSRSGITVTDETRDSLFEESLKDAQEDPSIKVIAKIENNFTKGLFDVLGIPAIECPQKILIKDADDKAFYLESVLDDQDRLDAVFSKRAKPTLSDPLQLYISTPEETATNFKNAFSFLKRAAKLAPQEFEKNLPVLKNNIAYCAGLSDHRPHSLTQKAEEGIDVSRPSPFSQKQQVITGPFPL